METEWAHRYRICNLVNQAVLVLHRMRLRSGSGNCTNDIYNIVHLTKIVRKISGIDLLGFKRVENQTLLSKLIELLVEHEPDLRRCLACITACINPKKDTPKSSDLKAVYMGMKVILHSFSCENEDIDKKYKAMSIRFEEFVTWSMFRDRFYKRMRFEAGLGPKEALYHGK